MKLSCDDLPMFFAEPHLALGARLQAAAAAFAAIEGVPHAAGPHTTKSAVRSDAGAERARDRAAESARARAAATHALDRAAVGDARDRAAAAHALDGAAVGDARDRAGAEHARDRAAREHVGAEHARDRAGDEHAKDRAAAALLASAGLFELVVDARASTLMRSSTPSTRTATGAPTLADRPIDTRALCLAREMLGYVSPRADSILAVQGLGTHAILLEGNDLQRGELNAFSRGAGIAAFALTEPDAGSDVAAIKTRAAPAGGGYRLDGEKLFISNLGIADHAMVFASTEPSLGGAGLTAFWVPLDSPGVTVETLEATAPHPIGALGLSGVMLPASARVGAEGQGMKLALKTLDAFRVSVGAAAVGMARRALDEALAFVTTRSQFGKPLAEQQLVQAHLADMAVDLDAARLLVLRAAYLKDTTAARVTTEVSIAKLGATEAAQRVIDSAVQLFGGRGVMAGSAVEHLYRAIRPLRIYEGTSEIQRTIIGRALAQGATT